MQIKPEADSVLTQWTAAKPVVALMGEFSAGKSTLLNLLLDGDHMPTKVTATNLPAVWVTHSDANYTRGLRHDGTIEDVEVDKLGEDVRDQFLLLQFGIPAPILKRTDIVDTPGISDPKLAKGATLFLGPYLDGVLWLSPANQAWRQTEKAVWSAFPKPLRDTSTIVLTRSDKLRRASDLTKVMKRVKQETKALFCEQVPLNTLLAANSKADPKSKDWETSGGKLFMAAFEKMLEAAEAAHAIRAKEYAAAQPTEPAAAPEPKAPPKKAQPKKTASKPRSKTVKEPTKATRERVAENANLSVVAFFDDALINAGEIKDLNQIKSFFEQTTARIEGQFSLNPVHRFVLKQCLNAGENENVNIERLLEQAKSELADFDHDPWCVLAPG